MMRLRAARGLTLVEVLVTLTIFVFVSWLMMVMVQQVIAGWARAERQRVLYERGAGAMDRIADDLASALCREPAGVDNVLVRFIGDLDPQTGMQRIMFVRAFEAGPERALTLFAGDGLVNDMRFRPADDEAAAKKATARRPDGDEFDGRPGDYRALGGMAQVAYFVRNQTLYRAIRAPAEGSFLDLMDEQRAAPLVNDVLYLSFDYWSQYSRSWQQPAKGSKGGGPEKVWDSTRAIAAAPLNEFIMHRGRDSMDDPEDDVFPLKVRIGVTVDSPMPRCTHTRLIEDIGSLDGMIFVESTRGFPEGGTEESYILIGDEWIHYKEKTEEAFIADARGARGTPRRDHRAQDVVRIGETFYRVVFLPGYREDWTPDDVWRQRREAEAGRQRGGR